MYCKGFAEWDPCMKRFEKIKLETYPHVKRFERIKLEI